LKLSPKLTSSRSRKAAKSSGKDNIKRGIYGTTTDSYCSRSFNPLHSASSPLPLRHELGGPPLCCVVVGGGGYDNCRTWVLKIEKEEGGGGKRGGNDCNRLRWIPEREVQNPVEEQANVHMLD
jgi:hypothetical protein